MLKHVITTNWSTLSKRLTNENGSMRSRLFVVASLLLYQYTVAFSAETIQISDSTVGCFDSKNVETLFTRTNDVFFSESRTIPANIIENLRKAILVGSKKSEKLSLEDLGITPETVVQHRADILEAALKYAKDVPKTVPSELEYLFEYPNISEVAAKSLKRHEGSTTRVAFKFVLEGQEKIAVESNHECPWMLPWKITVGDKSWESYSVEIPKFLAEIADSKGPNHPLLNGKEYWKSEFWKDRDVWDRVIGDPLGEYHAKQLAISLEGYQEFQKQFELKKAETNHFISQPFSLLLGIQTKKPSLVNSVWWYNPIESGKPVGNWNQFLKLYEACSKAASKHRWLEVWKASGKDRLVEGAFSGFVGHDAAKDLEEYVLPAWKDAGCKGLPEFKLRLRQGRGCHTVFISSGEKNALVVSSEKGTGSHWLDKEEVFFHPKTPDYIVVNPEGSFQRRTIK
jgi:hypothetical protein